MVSFVWSAKAQKTLALKISVMQKRKKWAFAQCVVAVLISYCSWGLISSSIPPGLCVVLILLYMGEMAQWI